MAETLQAFLDQGTSFEGKLSFSSTIRIDGHFRGEARAEGNLVIGESGLVEANLSIGELVVHGTLIGDAVAKGRIQVGATGRVVGSLSAPRILIEEGAQLEARIQMGEPATPATKPTDPTSDPDPTVQPDSR